MKPVDMEVGGLYAFGKDKAIYLLVSSKPKLNDSIPTGELIMSFLAIPDVWMLDEVCYPANIDIEQFRQIS